MSLVCGSCRHWSCQEVAEIGADVGEGQLGLVANIAMLQN
jgi:hypothetical protein